MLCVHLQICTQRKRVLSFRISTTARPHDAHTYRQFARGPRAQPHVRPIVVGAQAKQRLREAEIAMVYGVSELDALVPGAGLRIRDVLRRQCLQRLERVRQR